MATVPGQLVYLRVETRPLKFASDEPQVADTTGSSEKPVIQSDLVLLPIRHTLGLRDFESWFKVKNKSKFHTLATTTLRVYH